MYLRALPEVSYRRPPGLMLHGLGDDSSDDTLVQLSGPGVDSSVPPVAQATPSGASGSDIFGLFSTAITTAGKVLTTKPQPTPVYQVAAPVGTPATSPFAALAGGGILPLVILGLIGAAIYIATKK